MMVAYRVSISTIAKIVLSRRLPKNFSFLRKTVVSYADGASVIRSEFIKSDAAAVMVPSLK